MDWQQKLAALNALSECSLKMRKPGDWYVSQRVTVKRGSVLVGEYGNGVTPEEAVNDHWNQLAEDLPRGEYLVADLSGSRKAVRWNGFMWDAVIEPWQTAAPAGTGGGE